MPYVRLTRLPNWESECWRACSSPGSGTFIRARGACGPGSGRVGRHPGHVHGSPHGCVGMVGDRECAGTADVEQKADHAGGQKSRPAHFAADVRCCRASCCLCSRWVVLGLDPRGGIEGVGVGRHGWRTWARQHHVQDGGSRAGMLSPVTKAAAGPGKAGGCRWIFFLGAENIVSSVGHACCPQVAGGRGSSTFCCRF